MAVTIWGFQGFRSVAVVILLWGAPCCLAGKLAKDLGIPAGLHPRGPRNTITDVPGVRVGHVTLNEGRNHTGVTMIIPAEGDLAAQPIVAARATLNGNGEFTGAHWVEEFGKIEGPIALTNTASVPEVYRGLQDAGSVLPVVLECDDSTLNDMGAHAVARKHVADALRAAGTDFAQGAVGAGTGMISFDFKSGIGSASRAVTIKTDQGTKTTHVGVLVNSNIGTQTRNIFRFYGIPIANKIKDLLPIENPQQPDKKGAGSAVVVIATDAPMDTRQLERLATRALHAFARLGTVAYNGSGEFAIAFSTANRVPSASTADVFSQSVLQDTKMNDFQSH